ncbi:histidine triad nucleotide-binding protein [Brevibacillus fulvus]|uniref:Histidine triad (HIT) family protein n=1 Tax=Brevibacillus fulvus TaxID=1125967 RepID=A0A938XYJ6_9BACL|nr:histidine triad nucleotide-binding protein [Brevibacillus fulvus]MBM7588801.1 histidine triad (HIT) family protein [Brevibacillus fulvus]
MSADCLFCQIADGRLPARKVYEDDRVLAFHDINPIAPVHILLIPKKHIASLLEIAPEDKELVGHIHMCAQKAAQVAGVEQDGFRVVTNIGKNGQQTVFHLHYHLIGGRQLRWDM